MEDLNIKDFWNRVKRLIKDRNLTQRSLSSEIGYNERTIEAQINRNSIPNIFDAYLMAKVLNVSVEYLITGESPLPKTAETIDLLKKAIENLK